jgi:uncharacterized protein (TIGR00251 family)
MTSDLPIMESHPLGVALSIWAQPGAKRNVLVGVHQGKLKIAVTQIPEKGKATKEILILLAMELGLKKSQVSLLAGETSREKKVLISGISLAELALILQEKLKH